MSLPRDVASGLCVWQIEHPDWSPDADPYQG
jgi:hypothetical protein